MSLSVSFCKILNRFFPAPARRIDTISTEDIEYAELQFYQGVETLRFFKEFGQPDEIVKDKIVLNIGWKASTKAIYYSTLGSQYIISLDPDKKTSERAKSIAESKGLQDSIAFINNDLQTLPLESNVIDTIILDNVLEHTQDSFALLNECYRVLKKGGRLYINMLPYHHPYGAYLSDGIGIPWVHKLFDEQTLINVYKDVIRHRPDANERIAEKIGQQSDGEEFLSHINRTTLERFDRILAIAPFQVLHFQYLPLRSYFKTMAMLPIFQEYFVKRIVCVLEKASTKTRTSFYEQIE